MIYDALKNFRKYVEREIEPALADLEKLDERNRVHIQKLIYTNLADRFDTMIDIAVLDNCRESGFVEHSLKKMTGNVTESELVQILLQADNLQKALELKLENGLRNNVLNQRHSKKLAILFSVMQPDINCIGLQRVNAPTGKISEKVTPQRNVKTPCCISGYADWLYSRRNSLVHGGGSNRFLKNDRKQLQKIYKKEPAQTFKISIGSVTNAATFYKEVTDLLNE